MEKNTHPMQIGAKIMGLLESVGVGLVHFFWEVDGSAFLKDST